MRPSLCRSRQLSRTCEKATRRLSTPPPTWPSLSLCQICQSRILPRHTSTNPTSRRFISSSSSSSTSASASQTEASAPISRAQKANTYYDLFPKTLAAGPPPAGPFTIDARALRSEYLRLQAQHHPDLHSSSATSRLEGTSALINEAYKTLLSTLPRAQYLLGLRGLEIGEEAKEADPVLLGEVLEAREMIEEAEEESELEDMRRANEERIAECENVLERCFMEDDLSGARTEAVRLRYWVNIKESLDAWEKGKPVVLVH